MMISPFEKKKMKTTTKNDELNIYMKEKAATNKVKKKNIYLKHKLRSIYYIFQRVR